MDVDITGHLKIDEFLAKVTGGKHVVRGDRAVFQNVLLVINVVQEEIESGDALN